MLLFIHGLGSRVQALETTDLVEGGVVTEKLTTPKDTREHHTQYNRQTTALHSHRPLASGRGAACSCNAMWCGIGRLYFSHYPEMGIFTSNSTSKWHISHDTGADLQPWQLRRRTIRAKKSCGNFVGLADNGCLGVLGSRLGKFQPMASTLVAFLSKGRGASQLGFRIFHSDGSGGRLTKTASHTKEGLRTRVPFEGLGLLSSVVQWRRARGAIPKPKPRHSAASVI